MAGNNFVTNPGGGVSPARAPNFADQQMPQQKRSEEYAKQNKIGDGGVPLLDGSPQVGTGIGVPKGG